MGLIFFSLFAFFTNAFAYFPKTNFVHVESDRYNNGYQKKRYLEVINSFKKVYGPIIEKKGGEFHIIADWTDGAVNAWADRFGNEYQLEIPGGLSRYYLINEAGFVLIICHELGHLLGGRPSKGKRGFISVEGQSDYFASLKCMRRMNREIEIKIDRDPEVDLACREIPENQACLASLSGAKSVTSYYAELADEPAPSLKKKDPSRVKKTQRGHPKAQCRLDTYRSGALCPVRFEEEIDEDNFRRGVCHLTRFQEFARPRCWYSPLDPD